MADKNSSKNNFIMQAGILAAAGIISRIIGLLYRGPLQSVIGNLGLGYYQSAYNYYTIILLISSYSIPSAISKAIAQKLGEKEYRNAHRLFHGAMIYVLVVGGIASLFLFFGAGLFVSGAAVTVLRTFAPTIFVYGILGVLRGYFQAHKSMAQTSVSQILEQIANAVVSVGAAYLLIQMFMGTMEVPADQAGQVMRATYGAVGSALGTGVGVLVALLFMAGVYALNRGMILRRVQRDRHEHVDSYGQIFKTITLVVTPFILSTAVYNLSLHQIMAVMPLEARLVVIFQLRWPAAQADVLPDGGDLPDQLLCLLPGKDGAHEHPGVHRHIDGLRAVKRLEGVIQLFSRPLPGAHLFHTAHAVAAVDDQLSDLIHTCPSCLIPGRSCRRASALFRGTFFMPGAACGPAAGLTSAKGCTLPFYFTLFSLLT